MSEAGKGSQSEKLPVTIRENLPVNGENVPKIWIIFVCRLRGRWLHSKTSRHVCLHLAVPAIIIVTRYGQSWYTNVWSRKRITKWEITSFNSRKSTGKWGKHAKDLDNICLQTTGPWITQQVNQARIPTSCCTCYYHCNTIRTTMIHKCLQQDKSWNLGPKFWWTWKQF
jgi:hypothetical protein